MDGETFRSRLLTLLQRSRQAHRLYSSMERMQRGDAAEFTEMQASAWRSINAELIKQLTAYLDAPHSRQLSNQVVLLRDRFLSEFRANEADVHQRQRELIGASEKGDFVRAAVLSRSLVGLKARAQAVNAAFSELDELLGAQRGARSDVPEAFVGQPEIASLSESEVKILDERAGGYEPSGLESAIHGKLSQRDLSQHGLSPRELSRGEASAKQGKTGSALVQQKELERAREFHEFSTAISSRSRSRTAQLDDAPDFPPVGAQSAVSSGSRAGFGSSAVMSNNSRAAGPAVAPARAKVIPLRKRS